MTVEDVEAAPTQIRFEQIREARKLKPLRDPALGTEIKVGLHRFEFGAADAAKTTPRVLPLGRRPGLRFLASQFELGTGLICVEQPGQSCGRLSEIRLSRNSRRSWCLLVNDALTMDASMR
jgi:hypothetical protein